MKRFAKSMLAMGATALLLTACGQANTNTNTGTGGNATSSGGDSKTVF